MHTVDRLEQAVQVARQLGYKVRFEWLAGKTGGSCEINGQKWIFVDLSLAALEQLHQVTEVLREEPNAGTIPMAPVLRAILGHRKSA